MPTRTTRPRHGKAGAAAGRRKRSAKPQPLRPEQKARLIARLSERIKELQTAGKNDQAKRLALNWTISSAARWRPGSVREAGPAPALATRLSPTHVSSDKKTQLVRTAYLRTFSRYPDDHEQTRALAYLNDSDNVFAGLRDLLWALVNTEEFIVNH